MRKGETLRRGLCVAAALAAGAIFSGAAARADLYLQTFDTGTDNLGVGWGDAVVGWTGDYGNPPGCLSVQTGGPGNWATTVIAGWNPNPAVLNPTNLTSYQNIAFDVYVPSWYQSAELNLWVAFHSDAFPWAETPMANRTGNVNMSIRDAWQTVVLDIPDEVQQGPFTWVNEFIFGNPGENGQLHSDFLLDNVRLINPIVVDSAWNVDADGNWSVAGNWSAGVPNGSGHGATFGGVITAPRTVTVDLPVAVGTMTFNNANSYTIGGSGTITLANTGTNPVVRVLAGNHTISAPIVLGYDQNTFNVAAGSTLSLTGPVQYAFSWYGFRKEGAGTVQVERLLNGGLDLQEGTVKVSAKNTPNDPSGTSRFTWHFIDSDAKLDLTNNSAVFDYASPDPSPIATIQAELASGYNGGAWNGSGIVTSLGTSALGLGYIEASHWAAAHGLGSGPWTFAGQEVDDTTVLIKFTYMGDSDLDGDVDNADFGQFFSHFQQTGQTWFTGDFDYDGDVDNSDFGLFFATFNSPPLPSEPLVLGVGAAVPEPGVMGLIGFGLAGVALRRRRC